MANRQIRMSPDALLMRSEELSVQGNRMDEIIAALDSTVKALSSEWEGSASEAFLARFEELRPGFMNARDIIFDFSEALKRTAAEFEERDHEIAEAFVRGGRPAPLVK